MAYNSKQALKHAQKELFFLSAPFLCFHDRIHRHGQRSVIQTVENFISIVVQVPVEALTGDDAPWENFTRRRSLRMYSGKGLDSAPVMLLFAPVRPNNTCHQYTLTSHSASTYIVARFSVFKTAKEWKSGKRSGLRSFTKFSRGNAVIEF